MGSFILFFQEFYHEHIPLINRENNAHLKEQSNHSHSLASRVKSIVHQAYWDVLESELNAEPPEYDHAIKLFEEIREAS